MSRGIDQRRRAPADEISDEISSGNHIENPLHADQETEEGETGEDGVIKLSTDGDALANTANNRTPTSFKQNI